MGVRPSPVDSHRRRIGRGPGGAWATPRVRLAGPIGRARWCRSGRVPGADRRRRRRRWSTRRRPVLDAHGSDRAIPRSVNAARGSCHGSGLPWARWSFAKTDSWRILHHRGEVVVASEDEHTRHGEGVAECLHYGGHGFGVMRLSPVLTTKSGCTRPTRGAKPA